MSDCATWWFDHVGETYLYTVGVRQGDEKEQFVEVEKLAAGAEEWGKLLRLPEAAELMLEHSAALKALIDAAFAGDSGTMDAALHSLTMNAERQTALYAEKIERFPVDEWKTLFERHILTTAGYALGLAAGDAESFKKNLDATTLDRNALARLWTRVCAERRR